MVRKYKTRRPVSMLLIALLISNTQVFAMGLGNMEVRSFLGEPLRASVKLFDIPKGLDITCFKLVAHNDQGEAWPVAANMQLRKGTDNQAQLLIKSIQIESDPILNLTLVSSCETLMQREYVILLDPPISANAFANDFDTEALEDTAPVAVARLPAPDPKQLLGSEVNSQPQTLPLRSESTPKKATKPTNQRVSGSSNTVTTSSGRTPQPVPAPAPAVAPETPRLVVSGGESHAYLHEMPMQLQLSTTLGQWPATPSNAALSSTDVSDEITAMTNKLAYLESQIIALEARNRELEQSRLQSTAQADSTTSDFSNWLYYLLLAALLGAVLLIARWVRQRSQLRQMASSSALWDEMVPAKNRPDLIEDDFLVEESEFLPEAAGLAVSPENAKTSESKDAPKIDLFSSSFMTQQDGAEVNEDILEQAEVFVAHGRTALAIILLQDHLREAADISPAPWLMLLDLLKREGQQDEFEAACAECQKHFNVAVPDFTAPAVDDPSSLEDYPRVKERLEQVWGTADTIAFLDDLIYNRRAEARQGFERNAYLDILLLRSIANDLKFSGNKPTASILPFADKKQEKFQDSDLTEDAPEIVHNFYFDSEPESRLSDEDKSVPLEFDINVKVDRG
jgi:hypothetical protein